MSGQLFDIEIEQGATFTLQVTYKDAGGTPINLTGYKVRMQVRDKVGGKKIATATTENGHVTVSSLGVILVTITHTETASMAIIRGVYDLFLENPGATMVDRVLYGDVDIKNAVTL